MKMGLSGGHPAFSMEGRPWKSWSPRMMQSEFTGGYYVGLGCEGF